MDSCPVCRVIPSEGKTREVVLPRHKPSGFAVLDMLGPEPIRAYVCDCGAIFEKEPR